MRQWIYAHRGASGYAPENTLMAFDKAADMGADGVELDVQRTLDGVLVVFHDEKVDRVTDGTGMIAGMTLEQVRHLRVCKPFPQIADAGIPTLEEVYTLLKARGLKCNAELKNSVIPYDGLEAETLEMAAKCGMEEDVLYSSFNHVSMVRVHKLNAQAKCGLLYDAVMAEPEKYAQALGMQAIHPHYPEVMMNVGECMRAHELGIEVNPWTVNEEASLKAMLRAGADRVITNYPDVAVRMLKEMKEKNPA